MITSGEHQSSQMGSDCFYLFVRSCSACVGLSQPVRRLHRWNLLPSCWVQGRYLAAGRAGIPSSDVILEAPPLSCHSYRTWLYKCHLCVIKMKWCWSQCQAWINPCSCVACCSRCSVEWLIFHCGLGASGRSHSFTNRATDRAWTVIISFPAEKNRSRSRYANRSLRSGRNWTD